MAVQKIKTKEITPSRVSSGVWLLLIVFFILLDLAQIVLDFLVVGLIINRFIDIAVAFFLFVFLSMSGEMSYKPTRKRVLTALAGAFLLEFIPVIDALPLWSADIWFISKQAKKRNKDAEASKQKIADEIKANQKEEQDVYRLEMIKRENILGQQREEQQVRDIYMVDAINQQKQLRQQEELEV